MGNPGSKLPQSCQSFLLTHAALDVTTLCHILEHQNPSRRIGAATQRLCQRLENTCWGVDLVPKARHRRRSEKLFDLPITKLCQTSSDQALLSHRSTWV